jgi:DNA replication licensing factor MCM5
MAGWDEGNVFYSDQQLEDNDANVSDAASRHTAQRKFKEFIRSFGDVKGPFPYR